MKYVRDTDDLDICLVPVSQQLLIILADLITPRACAMGKVIGRVIVVVVVHKKSPDLGI